MRAVARAQGAAEAGGGRACGRRRRGEYQQSPDCHDLVSARADGGCKRSLYIKTAPSAQNDGRRGLRGFLDSYLPIDAWASAIFAFTASRLKLAPFCIGGNSIAVMASFSTCCWTNTKRQNSYLNQSKYCCAPSLVPLPGQPVRSNGSRRRLVR